MPGHHSQEERFLKEHGFGHLVEKFHEQEVTMDIMDSLTDADFRQLGVNTVGARHRFRAAAKTEEVALAASASLAAAAEVATPRAAASAAEASNQQLWTELNDNFSSDEQKLNTKVGTIEQEYLKGNHQESHQEEEEPIFLTVTKATGRVTHHFLFGFHRFSRQQIKRSGRACFPCSVKGCQARLFAQYCNRDKKMQDLEEPVLDQTSRFQHQDHLMADGTVHPIQVILLKYRRRRKEKQCIDIFSPQVGLRLAESFRRRLRSAVHASPSRHVGQLYREQMLEVQSGLEDRQRDEFLALCPTLGAMERCLYR